MFCWRSRKGKRHRDLWKAYTTRIQERTDEGSTIELDHHGIAHAPINSRAISASALSPSNMLESSSLLTLDLEIILQAFCAAYLTNEQVNMLRDARKNEASGAVGGECLFLPRQIRLDLPSSSVEINPVRLLGQVLRWPNLKDSPTKDLLRLRHLCTSHPSTLSSISQTSHKVYLPPEMGTLQKKLSAVSSQYSLTCNSKSKEDTCPSSASDSECCNPYHWSREVQLEVPSGLRMLPSSYVQSQRTSESKALMDMLYNPEYHSAETDSVKDFSESSSSDDVLSPSTKTGISRYECGQVSADSYRHELERLSDFPCEKKHQQYYSRESRSHHWCMVRYWEERALLGHAHFKVVQPVFNVYYDTPAAPRSQTSLGMSLVALENPNRTKKASDLRTKIGLGFQLILDEDRRVVTLYNRSKLPLFVSSLYLDTLDEEKVVRRAVKVLSGYSITASHLDFVPSAQGPNEPMKAKYDSIYVSFGKGWGENYSRSNHLSCTCWVEIQLDNAMADVKKSR